MFPAFQAMVSLQFQLFLLILAGFLLTKRQTISQQGSKTLSDLLIGFILPCNIIHSFQMDMDGQILAACGSVLILTVCIQAIYLMLSGFLFRGESGDRLACLRYGTVCSNAGFLGITIIGGVYGSIGSLLTSIALIPQRIVMWSAGISFFTRTDRKSVMRQLMTHPCIIAVVIGFVLMLSGNPRLPDPLQRTLNAVSDCTTSISMLVIGSILANAGRINFRDRTLWWYTAVRLILIPLVVFILLLPLPVHHTVKSTLVLISGMPAGSTTAILAAKYDGDAAFASCMVFISTLGSIVTLPLLCLLL